MVPRVPLVCMLLVCRVLLMAVLVLMLMGLAVLVAVPMAMGVLMAMGVHVLVFMLNAVGVGVLMLMFVFMLVLVKMFAFIVRVGVLVLVLLVHFFLLFSGGSVQTTPQKMIINYNCLSLSAQRQKKAAVPQGDKRPSWPILSGTPPGGVRAFFGHGWLTQNKHGPFSACVQLCAVTTYKN